MKHLFRPRCYETRNQLQGKTAKNTNTWRLKNTLLNNQWITGEVKRYIETNENETL